MPYTNIRITFLIFLCSFFITNPAFAQNLSQEKEQLPAETTTSPTISPEKTQSALWEFNPKAPIVKANIAAFSLQGKRLIQRLFVEDFDVIITPDNKKFIPLLRLLRTLQVPGLITNNTLEFKFEHFFSIKLDLSNKSLAVNNETSAIELIIGTSDVTNMAEVFVSDTILKKAFGFDYTWSDENYGYIIKVNTELEYFKKMRPPSESALSVKVKELSEILKETEPPAQPEASKGALSFLKTELYSDFYWRKQGNIENYHFAARPALTLWGNVFNGDYKLRLRNDFTYPDTRKQSLSSWVDTGLWTSKNDKILVNVGDTNFGLNDLVAPAVNLFGASFKYLSPAQVPQEDKLKERYFKSRRASFLATGVFDGYALLGSNVELWINNRLVSSEVVEEVRGAALGYGYYRFDGVGLLDKSLNQIKIVVTRPDGIVEEFHREILGTTQLLPGGQWAYSGGAGTHKERVSGNLVARGQFAGAQALYGVYDWMTLGVSAATQDEFAVIKDTNNNTARSPRGYYLAPEVRAKLFDRIFTKADLGVSSISDSSSPVLASKFNLEYYLERSRMEGVLFSFGPNYSNGITSVSDRKGYSLTYQSKIFKNCQARTGFLHIQDNLNGDLANTRKEDLTTADLNIPGFIPRSNLRLQLSHSERVDDLGKVKNDSMYTVEMENRLTAKLSLRGSNTFGDRIFYTDDLKSGLSIPSISSYYSYGKNIGLNYKLNPVHAIETKYWKTISREKIDFTSIYNHFDNITWRSRFNAGTDLITSKPFAKEFLEFNLGNGRDDRLGFKADYDSNGNEFSIGVYITLEDLFFLDRGKIKHVARQGITPESGGIKGDVYLDVNWNGHKDQGEPTVPNIKILMDGSPAGESDNKGHFFIPRRARRESVKISFDVDELPATYISNQGMQTAYWKEGVFTGVNLGVCVSGSITGKVEIKKDDGSIKEARGVRVILMSQDKETIKLDSITSDQGDFYIGQIQPGNYFLSLDKETMPPDCELTEEFKEIIIPTITKPYDLENITIRLNMKKLEEEKTKKVEVLIVNVEKEKKEKKNFRYYLIKWYSDIKIIVRHIIDSIKLKLKK